MTHTPPKRTRNVALKIAIVRAGVTQRYLAQQLGTYDVRMSRIIYGRESPTKHERRLMAKMLRCTEAELFQPDVV